MAMPGLLATGKVIITKEIAKNDLVAATRCPDRKYRIAPIGPRVSYLYGIVAMPAPEPVK